MEANEFFKLDIAANYDHQEVFDISVDVEPVIISKTGSENLIKLDSSDYVVRPGDKFYFLPGVNIPRIKLKDLTLKYGVRVVRDVKDATVVFGGESTGYKISYRTHLYEIPITLIKSFLDLSKSKMDVRDISKLETALEYYDKDVFYCDYSTKRIILDDEWPFFRTAIINPVFETLKTYGEDVNNSNWFAIVDEEESVKLLKKISGLNIKHEGTLLNILNGDDAVTIDEEIFGNLTEMLRSTDDDNIVLAMEIMANCNYKQSLMYLEILFKENSYNMTRITAKNHVNFKSLLSYLGKSTSNMSTTIDRIIFSLLEKGVVDAQKLDYIIDRYCDEIARQGNSAMLKVKTVTIDEKVLSFMNKNYEFDLLEEFETIPEPEPEPIPEVIENEEVVENTNTEEIIPKEEDFIWD